MTQDFKNKIIAWLTGKYEVETPTNIDPTFTQVQNYANNFMTQLESELGNNYTITGFLQAKDNENKDINTLVMYGNYDTDNYSAGFIGLIDEKFNIIQIMTQYTNGDFIDQFEVLNVADDGTYFGLTSGMFVMLNNFTIKLPTSTEYQVNYRIGYSIPDNTQLAGGSVKGIKKVPGSAEYIAYGNIYYQYMSRGYYKSFATYFKINVGEENEWVDFTTTNSTTGTNEDTKDVKISKNGDELVFTLQTITYGINIIAGYEELVGTLVEGETSIQLDIGRYINLVGGNKTTISTSTGINIKNVLQNVYVSFITVEGDYCINLITNDTEDFANLIYYLEGEVSSPSLPYIELITSDTLLFFMVNQETTNSEYNIIVGLIDNDNVYTQNVATVSSSPLFIANQVFNLCSFYIQVENNIYITRTVYNINNYNGSPYQSLESMNSNSGLLYDSSEVVIFARNLYNKTVNNNTTLSVLEVPNNYLNDIEFTKEELLSKTNNILNVSRETYIKNIFETLNINFLNTLIMKNENDPQNEIINIIGASRLNNSISSVMDYDNAKALKYRLNYTDNTNQIMNIDSNSVEYLDNMSIYDFYVYVGKEIDTIDIISNDEITTYVSINANNMEVGKYYNITQNVEII